MKKCCNNLTLYMMLARSLIMRKADTTIIKSHSLALGTMIKKAKGHFPPLPSYPVQV
jgi:hypothetical protein